jgi:aquaglyceroporin related protein
MDRESKLDRESKIDPYPRSEHIEAIHDDETSEFEDFPNRWSKVRNYMSEAAAEFLGTMIFIIFGCGVIAQVVVTGDPNASAHPRGDWLSINFGWAVGAAMGVWIAAGISGSHMNPALTIALATWRDFPWRKVPVYIIAQFAGAIVGALVIYANYCKGIDIVEGGAGIRTFKTASIFSSYPLDYVPNLSAFFDEFLATTVFVIGFLATLDGANGAPPSGMLAVAVFILVLGIGASLGGQTGYAINPARDWGPRIATAIVGYGMKVFTYRGYYWFWGPGIGSILGAQLGVAVYDVLIFTGKESVFNRPNKTKRTSNINVRVHSDSRVKIPAPVPLEHIV